MKKTLVMLLLLICAGCNEDGAQSATVPPPSGAQSQPAQPRMRSLSIAGADVVNSQALQGNSRTMTVNGGASAVQFQEGSGNSQTMNVNASGGNVTQRQSGSGNSQSMNIGVVDGLSDQGSVVRRNQ